MLTELSVVEQRYLAVREVLDGVRVSDVATRYGVDRRTVHRWLVRYADQGLGVADRGSRPDRSPYARPGSWSCAGPSQEDAGQAGIKCRLENRCRSLCRDD
jgi:transposase-like protein